MAATLWKALCLPLRDVQGWTGRGCDEKVGPVATDGMDSNSGGTFAGYLLTPSSQNAKVLRQVPLGQEGSWKQWESRQLMTQMLFTLMAVKCCFGH